MSILNKPINARTQRWIKFYLGSIKLPNLRCSQKNLHQYLKCKVRKCRHRISSGWMLLWSLDSLTLKRLTQDKQHLSRVVLCTSPGSGSAWGREGGREGGRRAGLTGQPQSGTFSIQHITNPGLAVMKQMGPLGYTTLEATVSPTPSFTQHYVRTTCLKRRCADLYSGTTLAHRGTKDELPACWDL